MLAIAFPLIEAAVAVQDASLDGDAGILLKLLIFESAVAPTQVSIDRATAKLNCFNM